MIVLYLLVGCATLGGILTLIAVFWNWMFKLIETGKLSTPVAMGLSVAGAFFLFLLPFAVAAWWFT